MSKIKLATVLGLTGLLGLGLALWDQRARSVPSRHRLASPNPPTKDFPRELVHFVPFKGNPVFSGTNRDTWDRLIRERGFILKEGGRYRLWYSGQNGERTGLGYATSTDGITWKRQTTRPLIPGIEDMFVLKVGETYHMFAEWTSNDRAHHLTSRDGIHFKDLGEIDLRDAKGRRITKGPYGTPTAWLEGKTCYLFYERADDAVWLATSRDFKVWTNLKDQPVLTRGSLPHERYAVALDHVIKHRGKYYAYYHGSPRKDWSWWTSNIAVSTDLVHWKKYPHNPILADNEASPIVVAEGDSYRLYAYLHPGMGLFLPAR
jgi:hypothetical protein